MSPLPDMDRPEMDRPDMDRPDWDQARLTAWLIERVADVCFLDTDEVDAHRLVNDFGLSSRDAVGLSGELEQLLDVELPATLFWENPTIAGLVAKLLPGEKPEPVRTDRRRRASDGPIAIVGVGCRFPGGADSPAAYWRLLAGGTDAVGEVPEERWAGFADRLDAEALDALPRHGGYLDDIAGFDAEFFGVTPREARLMDPQQRMVLEVAWEALEHAGIAPDSLRGSATGVYVGISSLDYAQLTIGLDAEAWSSTGASSSINANRLSYALDLRGPSVTIDTACSSSLVAVHQACQALRLGEISTALVGGANALISPTSTASMNALGVLSADGRCKPFAAGADGITRAEGCGMLVLKRLVDAERDGDRVLALIRGTAVNSDGRSNGLTAPNPDAQRALLEAAYEAAGVDPAEVDYVEAHGTGTLLGDPIEAGALGSVLGSGRHPERPLLVGSVKSNFGHLEAAAGVAGLIKVVLAMRADRVPPSLNYTEPNPHIPFDRSRLRVVEGLSPWPRYGRVARAGVSAFGFGGTNAHVVVEEIPPATVVLPPAPRAGGPLVESDPRPSVVLVSAANAERLRSGAGHLAAWAADSPDESVTDVAHTLARRRRSGLHRAAVVAASTAELAAGLRRVADGRVGPGVVTGTATRDPHHAVWLFSGYGSQWAGMGQGLLRTDEVFAAAVDELTGPYTEYAGISLRKLLETEQTVGLETTQLAIFGIQVSLARLWRSYGLEPAGVIGNSMGEVAAAVVAGGLSPEQGVRVMALRARLLARLDDGAGAMASVQLTEPELDELLDPGLPGPDLRGIDLRGIEVAVHTASDQLTVAGTPEEIGLLVERVVARERLARVLPLSVACHTAAVEPMLGGLAEGLTDLCPVPPSVRFYNTISENPRESPVFDAAHWVAGARRPVRFAQAVSAAAADGHTTFLELSPHPLMLGGVSRTVAGQGLRATAVASMRNDEPESVTAAGALAALDCAGVEVDWGRAARPGKIVSVPVVPWHHLRHWVESAPAGWTAPRADGVLGAPVEAPDGHGVALAWEAGWTRPLGAGDRRGALCEQLVLAAGRRALDTEAVDLVELIMREPAGEPVAVRTVAGRNGEVEVRTRADDGGWSVLAIARVRSTDRSAPAVRRPTRPAEVAVPATTDVSGRVREIIASISGYTPDQVPNDVSLADLGLDSLMANRIRNALVAEFDSVPDLRDIQRGITVEQIVAGLGPRTADPSRAAVVGVPAIEPRDAAERMMARLWTVELGVTPNSVTADFLALGGSREHAERLAERFTRELGHRFTADDVLARPVLHEMAGLVQPYVDGYDLARPVRVLRTGGHDGAAGGGPPLHLFHPAGGPTSVYQPLVDRLPAGIGCYGLEREREDGVPARVARHLEFVRGVQPEGPYRLCGWSFGGSLAFEAACQLQAAGAEVDLLVLIDTVRPSLPEGVEPRAFSAQRLSLLVSHIEQTYGKGVQLDHDALPLLDEIRQIEKVIAALGDAQLGMNGAVLRHQRTSIVDTHASERFEPGYFDGRMVLYRATEVFQGIAELDPRYTEPDPEGGWSGHCRELEVVPVRGDHLSVIDPPLVDAIAADLGARLAGATAQLEQAR